MLTVLTSLSRLPATKTLRLDRKTGRIIKTPYGREKLFRVRSFEIAGFDHLCRRLDKLTKWRSSFVIRGEPRPGIDLDKARRLLHDDPQTGDCATFMEAPRQWFAVDMDKVPRPAAIDPVADPDGAIEYLIGLLPPEVWDASCWWQFTSCQSLPGCEDQISGRLWFWLQRPLDDAALTRWALSANKGSGRQLVDPSIYRAVQPHYVADPIFEDGMRDPLPRRHGVRVGLDEAVALVVPEPSAADPYVGDDGYVGLGVVGHLAEIGGERGFRAPMLSAIAAYYGTNGADADPEPIKRRVREAIDRAPCGGRTAADLARYRSDRHLNDIVGWVRARERGRPEQSLADRLASFGDRLDQLAATVPVGAERPRIVKDIARVLLRRLDLSPRLAAELTQSWNAIHCTPPLPHEAVDAIIAEAAARQY